MNSILTERAVGNHEVMMRGTFANIRLRNQLAPGTEGGWTIFLPDGEKMSIYDAAVKYREAGVPLVVLAGKEYGSGSSRDWAAKGTRLLGVRAVIAESYERIHRSNLVGMGVLPLEFKAGENRETLGLTGHEIFEIGRRGLAHTQETNYGACKIRRWSGKDVLGGRARGYTRGSFLLPSWGHPAIRFAADALTLANSPSPRVPRSLRPGTFFAQTHQARAN